jgi:DNA-binding transcriptional LysR family regulator
MKLSGIDANLLASLEALLQERSVTRAARRLGVGQPAVSHSLARLRRQFNDPLLVLQGRSYVLTPKAIQLGVAVAKATRALADVFEDRPPFVPATSTQRFVIACSDWVGPVVLPPLVDLVRREASSVEIEIRALAPGAAEGPLDESVDFGLGIFDGVPPTLNQQPLYEDPAVCVVRESLELGGARMTAGSYASLPHPEITSQPGATTDFRVDRALAAAGLSRWVAVRIPFCLLATRVLEHADFVATMPSRAAHDLARMGRVRVLEPPLALPPYRFSLIWRVERGDEPAHAWLREAIASLCANGRR